MTSGNCISAPFKSSFIDAPTPAHRPRGRRVAVLERFPLHADTAVHGHDRQGLERHPRTGKALSFTAVPPKDFKTAETRLKAVR